MGHSLALKHWHLIFLTELKRLAAYRAQFWFELILSSIVELFVILTVWKAVFESTGKTTLGAFTYPELTLYLTVATFFGQAARGTGVGTFQREIYEGTLTKFLIYPLSVYSYKLGTFLPRAVFAFGQLVVVLLLLWCLGYWPEITSLSLSSVCTGICALIIACLLYFFMIICIEAFAFWADNIWALSYALQIAVIFLSGKAIPLDYFPDWLAAILKLSPFPLMVYFPTQVFLGQLPYSLVLSGFLAGISWVVLLFLLSKLIIARGLYQYTGVGQ